MEDAMSDTMRNENDPIVDPREGHVPPEAVEGAHESDGTMGRVAGTGSGLISGALVGSVAGPLGTVVGGIAGALLGAAAGNAAHHVGDDHDDVNVETGSGGDLGKNAGAGAGSISGAIIGASAGPVGAVAGAVAGGMLGAAAGNAAKDMGGDPDNPNVVPAAGTGTLMGTGTGYTELPLPPATGASAGASMETEAPLPGLSLAEAGLGGSAPMSPAPVSSAPVGAAAMPMSQSTDAGVMRVPVVEESLSVGKEMRQTGEVEVSKHVVQEEVQVPVTLRHEEVVVTRHAVDRPVGAGEAVIGESETIRVPVHEEVARVSKEARVAEEIEIQKRSMSHEQTVSDTVRREVVDIDQPTAGAGLGTTGVMSTGLAGTGTLGTGADLTPGNNVPGIQTGGTNADGTPDTRGLTEKAADALTGDATDDKTGRRI